MSDTKPTVVRHGAPYIVSESSYFNRISRETIYCWRVLGPSNTVIVDGQGVYPGLGQRICDALNEAYQLGMRHPRSEVTR